MENKNIQLQLKEEKLNKFLQFLDDNSKELYLDRDNTTGMVDKYIFIKIPIQENWYNIIGTDIYTKDLLDNISGMEQIKMNQICLYNTKTKLLYYPSVILEYDFNLKESNYPNLIGKLEENNNIKEYINNKLTNEIDTNKEAFIKKYQKIYDEIMEKDFDEFQYEAKTIAENIYITDNKEDNIKTYYDINEFSIMDKINYIENKEKFYTQKFDKYFNDYFSMSYRKNGIYKVLSRMIINDCVLEWLDKYNKNTDANLILRKKIYTCLNNLSDNVINVTCYFNINDNKAEIKMNVANFKYNIIHYYNSQEVAMNCSCNAESQLHQKLGVNNSYQIQYADIEYIFYSNKKIYQRT